MHPISLANKGLRGGVGKLSPSSPGDDGSGASTANNNYLTQSKRGSSESLNLLELRPMGSTQSSTSHSLEMGAGPVAPQKSVQGTLAQ